MLLLYWKLFWRFSKNELLLNLQNWCKKFPIQQASIAPWKILMGNIWSVVGLCAFSHQKLLIWWGEIKIYLPRTHYQHSQELHLAEACLPAPVAPSHADSYERASILGRSKLSCFPAFPAALCLPAACSAPDECLWPQRPGLRLKLRSKAYLFFFQVNPYLLRIGLVSGNPQVLHERSNEWMGKQR